MTHRHFKYEGWLYALAFLTAIVIRFIGLGNMPLTDAEAAPALQALRIAQSARPVLDPHPLYILSTSILFLMYGGGTNFLARFIPAFIGGLFVLAPRLFDDRLKPRPSLILAFFLAFDPGLIAISRQVASPMLAIAFLVFTAGFINKNKPVWAAVTAALTLLSGPAMWLGLLGAGLTYAIAQFFRSKTNEETNDIQSPPSNLPTFQLRPSAFILHPLFLLTLLLAGTLFFTVPSGLGSAFSSIPAFLKTWQAPSNISQRVMFLSLFAYQPFALLLAIIALLRGWTRGFRRVIFLSVWLFVQLLLVVFLPGRKMADLAWTLLPLYALASLELVRHITVHPEERREVAAVTLLILFIWIFAWLGMAGLNWLPPQDPNFNLRAGMLIGSILLLIISLALVAAGWSARIARIGGVWGMSICLGILGLGGAIGSAGLRGTNSPELWQLPNIPAHAELVRSTVSQVSELGRGNDHSASIVILGIDSPALEWALRENSVRLASSLDTSANPDIVVTAFDLNPQLAAAYRGQDFLWRQTPLWDSADAAAWLRWLSLREMPETQETILLWARSDLFLDD